MCMGYDVQNNLPPQSSTMYLAPGSNVETFRSLRVLFSTATVLQNSEAASGSNAILRQDDGMPA